jgi:flagellin
MTEQNLSITQNQVSTGLAVADASQNAAYWSIGQQLSSDSGIVTATNSALAQSQAVFGTATSAINSVITRINSINTAITEATNPGADISNINISLASLSAQLNDAIAGASFNGPNVLNGSIQAAMNFVSGFDASGPAAISTIGFTTQALSGLPIVPSTAQEPPITNVTTIGQLQTLALTNTSTATLAYGADQVANSSTLADTTGDTFTVTALSLDGTQTVTTYSGIDANGNATTIAAAASLDVSVTTTPPTGATSGLLDQGAYDLTSLGTGNSIQVSSTNASAMLSVVGAALRAVTSYSALIGATQDRMTAANTLNSALTTNYANGVSALVDADMNMASTRLQALQTQQQLGIQSLSIANQNSQLILKLFNG